MVYVVGKTSRLTVDLIHVWYECSEYIRTHNIRIQAHIQNAKKIAAATTAKHGQMKKMKRKTNILFFFV